MKFIILTIISLLITYLLSKITITQRDIDNRWNKRLVPTFGGIGIYAVSVIPLLGFSLINIVVVFTLSMLFFIGILDDLGSVSAKEKFFIQFLVSFTVVFICYLDCSFLGFIFTVFFMIALINATNFIDNMDGLAAGIGLIASLFLCYIYADDRILFLSAALLGFLILNLPPAWIFMGDCGSLVIGFLLGYYCICHSEVHWVKNMLILIVPLADITYVTAKRTFEGRKPWIGGTDHISHVLARKYGGKRALFILYSVGIIGGLAAILLIP